MTDIPTPSEQSYIDSSPNASARLNHWIEEGYKAPVGRRATIAKNGSRWRIDLASEAGSTWAEADSFPNAVHGALDAAREAGL